MTGQRAYQHSRICNVEENKNNEFKAHHRLSRAEVSDRERGERLLQPGSRTLCAFLNINETCKLYLGIRDDGQVTGHPLLAAQKTHFKQNLQKLFREHFNPPVDDYRYTIEFVPVLFDDNRTYPSGGLTVKAPHVLLRPPNVCWCHEELSKLRGAKNTIPHYVVEITIHPWDHSKDKENVIWPYYTTEENKCFKRYNASNHELVEDEVINDTLIDNASYKREKELRTGS